MSTSSPTLSFLNKGKNYHFLMNYIDYSLEDFLADERFQQWVLSPEDADHRFWESWLREHPEKQPLVTHARQQLQSLAAHENPDVTDQQLQNVWQRIEATRQFPRPAMAPVPRQRPAPRQARITPWYLKIAALFTGLLVCTAVFYTLRKPAAFVEQRTAYGQTKTVVLPDQSTVMLNSHSKIRYAAHWDSDEPRDVWVEGEAFFSVVPTRNHQKFRVKTPSGMAVEVLGTQFNVKNRSSETRVVLKSGKVQLSIPQNNRAKHVLMAPSESVELAKTTTGYIKTQVDLQPYLSWTQHKLIFKNTPIAQIKTLLEETYGLTVSIPDTSLLRQQISGSLPSNNVESLLFALSESFDYTIVRKNNQLIFLKSDTD